MTDPRKFTGDLQVECIERPTPYDPFVKWRNRFSMEAKSVAYTTMCDCSFWRILLRRCEGPACKQTKFLIVGRFK